MLPLQERHEAAVRVGVGVGQEAHCIVLLCCCGGVGMLLAAVLGGAFNVVDAGRDVLHLTFFSSGERDGGKI